jgi:hypothetical protein
LRDYAPRGKVENVPGHYTVGLVAKGKADRVAVDAEDALIAALKVKSERPDATITSVRRQNPAAMRGIRPTASPATAAELRALCA